MKVTEGEVAADGNYKPRTDQEIRELAMDVCDGRVFGSWQVDNPDLIRSIFMPLIFLDAISAKDMKASGVVHLYEEVSKAGPRAINGYPIFMSMKTLNQSDVDRLRAEIDAVVKMRNAYLNRETSS